MVQLKLKNKMLSAFVVTLLMNSTVFAEDKFDKSEVTSLREWSYSLALQAATWGAPIVTMYALRHHDATGPNAKAQVNQIWRMEDVSTPELSEQAGYVTPNVNVIYGFGFMDLSLEPIILEVPDSNNLYYMVQIVDMWTNAFDYVGGKTTGYKGGKYILIGPDWDGEIPVGLKPIESPTQWVLLQPRVHTYVDGKIDMERAKNVMNQIKTKGLSEYLGEKTLQLPKYEYTAPDVVNPKLPVSALDFKDPLQFWDILVDAMNENPPPDDEIDALLPMFKPLGIELDKPWDRTKLPQEVLASMSEAAKKIGGMLANLPFGTLYKGSFIPPLSIGDSENDYQTRAIVARVGLTANTPFEAIYWMTVLDSEGNPLTGDKKYTMTFKEGIPYYEPGFWSVTMYDSKNNYTVPNPINRYMLGSDTPDVKKNEDGSFTYIIQKDSPGKDLESNWLPTPAGSFYLIPRCYAPKPEAINILNDVTSWPIPAVVPIKDQTS